MGEGKGTVLVLDDEPSLRLLCRVNLELAGYRVLEAGTLEEARRALDSEPVDAALLDMHVGTEYGLELIPELRGLEPPAAVVVLSGTSEVTSVAAEPTRWAMSSVRTSSKSCWAKTSAAPLTIANRVSSLFFLPRMLTSKNGTDQSVLE